jgi:hypothetical protein
VLERLALLKSSPARARPVEPDVVSVVPAPATVVLAAQTTQVQPRVRPRERPRIVDDPPRRRGGAFKWLLFLGMMIFALLFVVLCGPMLFVAWMLPRGSQVANSADGPNFNPVFPGFHQKPGFPVVNIPGVTTPMPTQETAKPIAPADIPKRLDELKTSQDRTRQTEIAQAFAATKVKEETKKYQEDVAKALAGLILVTGVRSSPPEPDTSAARALGVWGTKESGPVLIRCLENFYQTVREEAMQSLSQLKDERGIEPIAKKLAEFPYRARAAKALIGYGSVAEKGVWPMLESSDAFTQAKAAKVLGEIGTSASIPPLEKATQSRWLNAQQAAQDAIGSIQRRGQKPPPPPPEEVLGGRKPWQIEQGRRFVAEFVRIQIGLSNLV